MASTGPPVRSPGSTHSAPPCPRPSSTAPSPISPTYGVTSTPVIDASLRHRLRHRLHLGRLQSRLGHVARLCLRCQHRRPPAGVADHHRGHGQQRSQQRFDPTVELQRTGLLLLGGRIFFGFSNGCDLGAYKGWISSISTTTRAQSLWVDETGSQRPGRHLAVRWWVCLRRDVHLRHHRQRRRHPVPVGPGTTPQGALGESTLRLTVDCSGNLHQADRFTPFNAASPSPTRTTTSRRGHPPSCPTASAPSPAIPHLVVQPSKATLVPARPRQPRGDGRAERS